MQTILVPVVSTDSDMNTARYAMHFAKQTGASKIILFDAIDNYFESDNDAQTIELEWEFYDHVVKEREKDLEMLRLKLLEFDSSVTLQTHCETVRLRYAINDICKNLNVDLIITGRMYNDTLSESLFGSNVIALAKESEKPVIIVPKDINFDPLEEVLLACNFNNITKNNSAMPVKEILDATHAKIFVLHVDDENNDQPQTMQCESEEFTALLKDYNAEYHNLPADDFRVAINDFVSDKKIDLIITIPKKQGLFEGLFKKNYTKEFAFHTHVPLMVLH